MKKSWVAGSGLMVAFLAGGFLLIGQNSNNQPTTTEQVKDEITQPQASESAQTSETATGSANTEGMKEIIVEGSNFKFVPAEIKVKKGEKVKITFKNTNGFHDFVIPELKVATKQANSPTEEVVEFTAVTTGTFEYYCSVGKHKDMGMVGKFIVE